MLANQSVIPRLPLPSIAHSLSAYSHILQTLNKFHEHFNISKTSNEGYASLIETVSKIIQEAQSQNILVQELLETEKLKKENWVEDLWRDDVYLSTRLSSVLSQNYFAYYTLRLTKKNESGSVSTLDQLWSASFMVEATNHFASLIDNQQVTCDVLPSRDGTRKENLCMNMYPQIFSTARIPNSPHDSVLTNPSFQSKNQAPSHIIVVRKNSFYKLSFRNVNLSPIERIKSLHSKLKEIVKDADERNFEDGVGCLTTLPRGEWHSIRQVLESDPQNQNSLKTIDEAIYVLCLDQNTPQSPLQVLQSALHGLDVDSTNRWFDKAQLIVLPNSYLAMNGDHSLTEGFPLLRIWSSIFIRAREHVRKNDYESQSQSTADQQIQYLTSERLEWNLQPQIKQQIRTSDLIFTHRIRHIDLQIVSFSEFGAKRLKQSKMDSDAVIQIAVQLAYFTFFKTFGIFVQPISIRNFLHGRTDFLSLNTHPTCLFILSAVDPQSTDSERRQLLLKAIDYHVESADKVSQGQGYENHLLALRQLCSQVAPKNPLLEQFFHPDSKYWDTRKWNLYTSTGGIGFLKPSLTSKVYASEIKRFVEHWKSSSSDESKKKPFLNIHQTHTEYHPTCCYCQASRFTVVDFVGSPKNVGVCYYLEEDNISFSIESKKKCGISSCLCAFDTIKREDWNSLNFGESLKEALRIMSRVLQTNLSSL